MNERALAGLFLIACASALVWAWWTGRLNTLLLGATSRIGGVGTAANSTPLGGTPPTSGQTPQYGKTPKGAVL